MNNTTSQTRDLAARLAREAVNLVAAGKNAFIVLEPTGPVVQDHMDETTGQLMDRGVRGYKGLHPTELLEQDIAEFISDGPSETLDISGITDALEAAKYETDPGARRDLIDQALELLGIRPAKPPQPPKPPGDDIRKWTAEGL